MILRCVIISLTILMGGCYEQDMNMRRKIYTECIASATVNSVNEYADIVKACNDTSYHLSWK